MRRHLLEKPFPRSTPIVEEALRKRLALIKARAERLRQLYIARRAHWHAGRESTARPLDPGGVREWPGEGEESRDGPSVSGSAAFESGSGEWREGETWEPPRLEEIVPGEECSVEGQPFFLVRRRGSSIDDSAKAEAARFQLAVENLHRWAYRTPIRARGGPIPIRAARDRICLLDIETAGLSPSTYIILCGMMFLEDDEFVVEQAFARDYDEEGGVLKYIGKLLGRFHTLVTYNGKTFDIPFIRTRMAVNRIDFEERFSHVDLLGHTRRVFSGVLENCKLETVERHLRGKRREDDIPGSEIPGVYHAFVRTGDATLIERVFYHNRMDLFAMAIFLNQYGLRESGA